MLGRYKLQIAEPLAHVFSFLEVEIAIAKLKKYKSLDSGQILAELIQAGAETLLAVIHKLINSIWIRENCLMSGRSLLLY
jgi:hypothetical protein